MIPSNLKVGDTFIDEGLTYKVIGMHELGYYISEKYTGEVVKSEPKEEKAEYTKTQINRLPIIELEALCEKLGIDKGTGSEMKKAIISKLEL